MTRSPDPCRLVYFLGFAGLAVYCRNAAIYSNSGRGRRALETALLIWWTVPAPDNELR